MGHTARKRFGQHFLVDLSVIDALVHAIDPQPADRMVEIGPGLGALTQPLLERLDQLVVVELDRDLAQRLRQRWPSQHLQVVEADALQVDFGSLCGADLPLRVVGNLPYNISTPLLFHLARWADQVRDQHFMLQREVVDRMVAQPGDSNYGRLSVMLQARYRMALLFEVSQEAFDPPPRVVSAVVRLRPLVGARLRRPVSPPLFEAVVARAFGQRRKMLRGSLAPWVQYLDWERLGVAPVARPQELSVAQFMDVADALAAVSVPPGALQAGTVPPA